MNLILKEAGMQNHKNKPARARQLLAYIFEEPFQVRNVHQHHRRYDAVELLRMRRDAVGQIRLHKFDAGMARPRLRK